jgi:GNAT superfamily N-acetyltransferase
MITYKSENPYDIKEELIPIAAKHYEEDPRAKAIPIDVDWVLYSEAYEAGQIATMSARDEGVIVGYVTAVIKNHQHTKDSKMALMDSIYVEDSYRNKGVAKDLIIEMEESLIDAGVEWFNATFRDEATAEGVLGGLGYAKVECVFGKSLKENT